LRTLGCAWRGLEIRKELGIRAIDGKISGVVKLVEIVVNVLEMWVPQNFQIHKF
jgi:hypothetical protein